MNLTEFAQFQKSTFRFRNEYSQICLEVDKTLNIKVEAYQFIYNFHVDEILSAVQIWSASSSLHPDSLRA